MPDSTLNRSEPRSLPDKPIPPVTWDLLGNAIALDDLRSNQSKVARSAPSWPEAQRPLWASTLDADPDAAEQALAAATAAGIDLATVTAQLEREGVRSFCDSYHSCWTASSASSPREPPGNKHNTPGSQAAEPADGVTG